MICPHCSQTFEQTEGPGQPKKYCSRQCQSNGCKSSERKLLRGPRPCSECGVVFTRGLFDKRRLYCSSSCKNKNIRRRQEQKRRARMRGVDAETVKALEVFDRDGWRCQLCNRRTPKRLQGKMHPRAPQLDHIVPLAVGGPHNYRNTQCSCMECNRAKGTKLLGQLRLFG